MCSTPFSLCHHEFHLTVYRFRSHQSPSLTGVMEPQQNHTGQKWVTFFPIPAIWELCNLKIFFLQIMTIKYIILKFITELIFKNDDSYMAYEQAEHQIWILWPTWWQQRGLGLIQGPKFQHKTGPLKGCPPCKCRRDTHILIHKHA